ncbi:Oidioi.mRNA.OKI2018_I69.chr1.g2139.t1.cds [Oikopleura dioica]|uniref:Oidioi.mRNA.OKI2018_I69.chr1.g2139.t1.cds n=1 Tax=Oikopleura dioica TaxID=34765 RepID=A0ABN7SQ58_OIKDI|nr:Oidioi.mRNA.OKI2018_I69.chr1.g2139.t1.cds [Oikopleura dioica]
MQRERERREAVRMNQENIRTEKSNGTIYQPFLCNVDLRNCDIFPQFIVRSDGNMYRFNIAGSYSDTTYKTSCDGIRPDGESCLATMTIEIPSTHDVEWLVKPSKEVIDKTRYTIKWEVSERHTCVPVAMPEFESPEYRRVRLIGNPQRLRVRDYFSSDSSEETDSESETESDSGHGDDGTSSSLDAFFERPPGYTRDDLPEELRGRRYNVFNMMASDGLRRIDPSPDRLLEDRVISIEAQMRERQYVQETDSEPEEEEVTEDEMEYTDESDEEEPLDTDDDDDNSVNGDESVPIYSDLFN